MRSSMRSGAEAPKCACQSISPPCHTDRDCTNVVTTIVRLDGLILRLCDDCALTYLECTGWEPVEP